MSEKFPYLLISEDHIPRHILPILEKLNNLCAKYQRTEEDVEERRLLLESLHSNYWQSIIEIIPALITEESKEDFRIPEGLHKWINFGCVSDQLCPEHEKMTTIQETVPEDIADIFGEYKIVYLDWWYKNQQEKNVRLKHKRLVEAKFEKAQKELDDYPNLIGECHEKRRAFLEKYPLAVDVLKTSKKIDELLPQYSFIKDKIERSQRITTQERIRYVELNDELNTFRELRTREQQAINDKVPQHEMMHLDREVENTILLKAVLEDNLKKTKADIEEYTEWRKSMTVITCRELLKEELRRVRIMTELAARRSHIRPNSILRDTNPVPNPVQIVVAIEDILEVDPTLFTKGGTKRVKFPMILVIPVFGDGIYDYERNALLIPTRSPHGLLQAVATALIEFHLDSEAGGHFRASYLELRKDEGIYSSIQLRERMVKDYLSWVTLEAKGYQILDDKTRKWFICNVAPGTFALKHPRRLGEFLVGEAYDLIDKYEKIVEKETQDFDAHFQLGIVYWRIGEYGKANIVFVHSAELRPESADACYNAAISCFKTGQKQKAIDYWRRYLSLDKASFWTVRTQKFLTTVR